MKSAWENPAMKVKDATEIRRHTAGAEAVMNEHWGTK